MLVEVTHVTFLAVVEVNGRDVAGIGQQAR